MIKYNIPLHLGFEDAFVLDAINGHHIGGDGPYSQKVTQWMQNQFKTQKVVLTTSCSTALDMACMLAGFKEGDEVICPSFTFPTSASSIAHTGAKVIFVDIHKETMNIDETLIEAAITKKTKGIMVMHYAGVACEMDTIMEIANRHQLIVIEDAAQCFDARYKGKQLGTLGHFGTFSFHETKNFTMGEGGALIIRDDIYNDQADNIKDSGTDRQGFLKGKVSAYSWVTLGSSYMPNEMSAAYLYGQLDHVKEVTQKRLEIYHHYYEGLKSLERDGYIELPKIPKECEPNGHIFFIKTKHEEERKALISFLKNLKIQTVFHYVPLHSSKAGKEVGTFFGEDRYTSIESSRLLRLPLHFGLSKEEIDHIISSIQLFYRG